MMRAMVTAATGMRAQETRMSVTANNLANASTTGFKRARAEFEDMLVERVVESQVAQVQGGPARPSPLEIGLGARAVATTRSFAQGDMIGTQNPLDVAIEGRGFLQVLRPDGELSYTRAGNLRIDAGGRFVTQHGLSIEPAITVPPDAIAVNITGDGRVSARVPGRDQPIELGVLELALFPNEGGLHSLGGNLYSATEASGVPLVVAPGEQGSGALVQGFLEGANVRTVEEMIDLIATQRAYELNSKVIQTADEMLRRLGQVG